ncbi:MAG: hypothetical protein HQL84_05670 [Magnetococcales bacterium]|nr:hypothetical protein [Magnetococcales bacterium]MBF0149521.1 hypothetical protein [Magnetococcales bacterium]MBF0174404.1 hypothetical protein [Magnetococcales bacterium]MBF0348050.1 hypothetical protein [Magnetococcales bacterium]MBF0630817.1 hypothetical protein [Magnetococcales bacterium]
MGFPPPEGFKLSLTKATPSPFNHDTLKGQLESIGLNCSELTQSTLQTYVDQVHSQIPDGEVQSFAILAPANDQEIMSLVMPGMALLQTSSSASDMVQVATGDWTADNFADNYGPELQVIQNPDHFKWLYDNSGTTKFTGQYGNPIIKTGYYKTADAIKELFIDSAVAASSALVTGLNKESIQAVMTSVVNPMVNSDLSNYVLENKSRVILLVQMNGDLYTGIGVLTIDYSLYVHDYKRKSKDGGDTHDTKLNMSARAVLYTDPNVLCGNYHAVLKQFNLPDTPTIRC